MLELSPLLIKNPDSIISGGSMVSRLLQWFNFSPLLFSVGCFHKTSVRRKSKNLSNLKQNSKDNSLLVGTIVFTNIFYLTNIPILLFCELQRTRWLKLGLNLSLIIWAHSFRRILAYFLGFEKIFHKSFKLDH